MSADEPTSARAEAAHEVAVLNRDLFFGVRIGNLLRSAGYEVSFASSAAEFVERVRDEPTPVLGLIDMSAGVDWSAIAAVAGGDVPLLAFGPHKDVASFRAAKKAGVTRVVSNGEFHRDALNLVGRYALRGPSEAVRRE